MPRFESHLLQAQRNLKFLEVSASCFDIVSEYLEWYMTVKFYTALHLVDAVFAKSGIHPPDHKGRNDGIFKFKKQFSTECARRFVDLYNLSIKARYLQDEGATDLKADLIDFEEGFEIVKSEIENKLKIKL